jgi:hypothetical protein
MLAKFLLKFQDGTKYDLNLEPAKKVTIGEHSFSTQRHTKRELNPSSTKLTLIPNIVCCGLANF